MSVGLLRRLKVALFGEKERGGLDEKAPARSSIAEAWQIGSYNPDDLVEKNGEAVYQQMLREPYVKAGLRQVKMGVTSLDWDVAPASDSAEDLAAAAFVRYALERLDGVFKQDLYDILDALDVGHSITEKVCRVIERGPFAGKIGLRCLKAKDPSLFEFEMDRFLNITGLVLSLDTDEPVWLDPRDFIIFAHLGRYESP